MQDQNLTCKDCGASFVWTSGEQKFYQDKGFTNPPSRCVDCRAKKRQDQSAGYEITCAQCGKKDTVSFQPRGDKPVLCRDCFRSSKSA